MWKPKFSLLDQESWWSSSLTDFIEWVGEPHVTKIIAITMITIKRMTHWKVRGHSNGKYRFASCAIVRLSADGDGSSAGHIIWKLRSRSGLAIRIERCTKGIFDAKVLEHVTISGQPFELNLLEDYDRLGFLKTCCWRIYFQREAFRL